MKKTLTFYIFSCTAITVLLSALCTFSQKSTNPPQTQPVIGSGITIVPPSTGSPLTPGQLTPGVGLPTLPGQTPLLPSTPPPPGQPPAGAQQPSPSQPPAGAQQPPTQQPSPGTQPTAGTQQPPPIQPPSAAPTQTPAPSSAQQPLTPSIPPSTPTAPGTQPAAGAQQPPAQPPTPAPSQQPPSAAPAQTPAPSSAQPQLTPSIPPSAPTAPGTQPVAGAQQPPAQPPTPAPSQQPPSAAPAQTPAPSSAQPQMTPSIPPSAPTSQAAKAPVPQQQAPRPSVPPRAQPTTTPVGRPPVAAPKPDFQRLMQDQTRAPIAPPTAPPAVAPQPEKIEPTKKPKKPRAIEREGLIDFSFDNTPLVDVIKLYAKKKKLNIILPQQSAAIKQKITFSPDRLLTLKEAEKYLYLFLDYAGYTVSPGPDFAIVIKGKEAAKNALPLYVFDSSGNLKIEDLPDNDAFVRAVYYFSNLKVSDAADTPVIKVLQDILSSPENVFADSQSNGVILTDKSRVIRSALQILRELDSIGSRYVLTTLQLYNAGAPAVADMLKTQLLATQPRGFGEEKSAAGVGSYFSSNMKVVADDRRNTLIIWGKEAAVNRLKDFVREYMDAPPESGKSVFHVYDLKYLDAESFATVLAQVVQSQGIGDQTTQVQTGGARKFFEGVVVRAETYKPVESPAQTAGQPSDFEQSTSPVSSTGTVYRGGNRILVAAQPSDWDQIKRLIDQLDIPQRQVILEVLICDYTRNIIKSLGSQVRDLERMDFRPGVGFQTAHLTDNPPPIGIQVNSDTNPTSITGDLLRLLADDQGNVGTIISGLDEGSFVISLNDPAGTGIWGVFSLLNSIGSAKIITHPYLVALNNTNATINNTEIRRGTGDNSSSQGGAITVNIQDFTATISLSLTPRISSSDRLNIEVIVQIQEFTSNAGFDRASRVMQTNVNMSSPDQVLVLGGLTRLTKQESTSETPILGRIPLFQWFFRRSELSTSETELAIFIRPTIIEPKLRDTMNAYTRSKIRTGAKASDMYALGNPKDPIVRFFFGSTPPEEHIIEEYMRETNIVPAPEIIKPESPVVHEEAPAVNDNLGVVRVS